MMLLRPGPESCSRLQGSIGREFVYSMSNTPSMFLKKYSAYILLAAVMFCTAGCQDLCDDTRSCPGLQRSWYRDADADGSSDGTGVCSLFRPGAGYSGPNRLAGCSVDCDDTDPAVHPGAQEVCDDGRDNDCDGVVDNCSTGPASVWKPAPHTSWQWQLTGTVDTSFAVDMYDIDLFDNTASLINRLHNDGRKVICYFSAGSWENWRSDASQYPASVIGKQLEGWPDEHWLDIRRLDILGPLIGARLDLAVRKGCDGVEPDNVDTYLNDSGFPLTAADQITFNTWLAQQSHARNLSVGLKNDIDQIPQLINNFDWALNEQCFQYDECDMLLPFVNAGKAVFGVEYELDTSGFCPEANALNFDFLKKNLDLAAYRVSCR
jgi:hypothetical protein